MTVITCVPNFPKGKVYPGYKNKLWQVEYVDNIRVIRVWSYIASNEGFIKRILDFLSYMITSFIAALFVRQVDIVVGTSPQFFTTISAYATSVIKKKPFVFELRDLWPESIRALGAMQGSRLLDILEYIEIFLYRRAVLIISVTNSFKDVLIRRGINSKKIKVITNGVDTAKFYPMKKNRELLRRLRLDDAFIVGYIGTHGMAHSLETILYSANYFQEFHKEKNIRFVFVGDGAEKSKLKSMSGKMKLENVFFIDSVDKEVVADYWSLLDVAIVHLRDTKLFETVIPSKIFECMSMGIPILHGVKGESAAIVEDNAVGLLFKPEDFSDLSRCILNLVNDNQLRQEMSSKGPLTAQKYDRAALAKKMLQQLQNTVDEH